MNSEYNTNYINNCFCCNENGINITNFKEYNYNDFNIIKKKFDINNQNNSVELDKKIFDKIIIFTETAKVFEYDLESLDLQDPVIFIYGICPKFFKFFHQIVYNFFSLFENKFLIFFKSLSSSTRKILKFLTLIILLVALILIILLCIYIFNNFEFILFFLIDFILFVIYIIIYICFITTLMMYNK